MEKGIIEDDQIRKVYEAVLGMNELNVLYDKETEDLEILNIVNGDYEDFTMIVSKDFVQVNFNNWRTVNGKIKITSEEVATFNISLCKMYDLSQENINCIFQTAFLIAE